MADFIQMFNSWIVNLCQLLAMLVITIGIVKALIIFKKMPCLVKNQVMRSKKAGLNWGIPFR